MLTSRRSSFPAALAAKASILTGTFLATSLVLSAAHAVGFGHSRIVSAPGQPLHIEIPVTDLTQADIDTLRATPAPVDAWQQVGMTPPVPLDSMRLVLLDGYRPGVKVIRLRSDQPSQQPIVDVLLDIRSASGQQRYQVSLLAHADPQGVQRAQVGAASGARAIDGRATSGTAADHPSAGTQIRVRSGDTMFAIARRNAVQGVTVYQMMIALQRANPDAFIHDNVNLVRAGATLTMPDYATLTALSDREARRIFQQHAQAFARYRQRSSGADIAAVATSGPAAAQGEVAQAASAPAPAESAVPPAGGDRLRLSGSAGTGESGNAGAAAGTAVNGSAHAGAAAGTEAGRAAGAAGGGANGATDDRPGVNLLAASGAIASDAMPHGPSSGQNAGSGANGAAGGQGATGTASGNGTSASVFDDDEAARRKNIEESRSRVIELEDNVRHISEALQKQGHVAAEAALEGARSVTEVIKEAIEEAIGLADDETGESADTQASGVAPDASGAPAAGAGGSAAGVEPAAGAPGTTAGAGAEAAGDAGAAAPGRGGAAASSTADAAATDSAAAGAAGSDAMQPPGAPAAGVAAGTPATGASAPGATPGGASAGAPASQAAPGPVVADGSAAKAPRKTSWLQENLLLALGGGLVLLILIVVWILKRIGASERNAFESDSPITDSMVREKLRDIDLELDHSRSGGGRPGE